MYLNTGYSACFSDNFSVFADYFDLDKADFVLTDDSDRLECLSFRADCSGYCSKLTAFLKKQESLTIPADLKN